MIQRSKAIVINSIKYGETSLVTTMYTRDFGMLKFIISGVRKNKSRHSAAFFQSGSLLEVIAYIKSGNGLNRIKEVRGYAPFSQIPFDIKKSSTLLFMVEVISKTITDPDGQEELFDMLEAFILRLDQREDRLAWQPIEFMLLLAQNLGFGPQPDPPGTYFDLKEGTFSEEVYPQGYPLDAEQSQLLLDLLEHRTPEVSAKSRITLLKSLIQYYQLHLAGFGQLQSVEILQQVLSK